MSKKGLGLSIRFDRTPTCSGAARNFRQGVRQSVAFCSELAQMTKILAHPLGFTRRPMTLRNRMLKIRIFQTGGAYGPYATCMATPLPTCDRHGQTDRNRAIASTRASTASRG